MVGAFLMPKFRKGGAYGGKQNQGYHCRDRRRYHKASDSLKHLVDGEGAEFIKPLLRAVRDGRICMLCHDIGDAL